MSTTTSSLGNCLMHKVVIMQCQVVNNRKDVSLSPTEVKFKTRKNNSMFFSLVVHQLLCVS